MMDAIAPMLVAIAASGVIFTPVILVGLALEQDRKERRGHGRSPNDRADTASPDPGRWPNT
ncbi:hypothetical protein [Leucobacter sp. NPDC077196]|uniref:hypothetical protein n=1 Tax=Leucobacter sp. NPDC077196 TaxID=3154959 RepID=UPI00341420C1